MNYKGVKDNADVFFPSVGLKISTTNGGTDVNTNCIIDPSTYSLSNANTFTQGASGSSYASANNLMDVTITQVANYLLVGAFPYTGTTKTGNIYVRKIEIVETAPTPTFTITPSSTTVPCSSTTAKTFTVNNVNNSQGTLSYNWNLGSTNNGWIYNGSAAPQTFTTSTNSITLTSSSGATSYSNVSVTVVLNGINNTTLTSTVTTTPTQVTGLSITGDDIICAYNTYNYTVNNVPAGASVNWSALPAGAVQFSCATCPQTDVTVTGNQSAYITAAITSSCIDTEISKTLLYGNIREYADVQHINPYNPCFQLNQFYTFYIANPQEGVHYKWGLESPSTGLVMDPNQTDNTYGYFSFTEYEHNRVVAIPYSLCSGDGEYDDYQVYVSPYGCVGYRVQPNIELFPNPARDQVTVKLKQLNARQTMGQLKDIREVRIVDKLGSVKRTVKYPPNTNAVNLNISNLPIDTYYIEVTDGRSNARMPLSVIK